MLTYRSSVAQDGVIRGLAGAPDTEFRLATLPTIHGERVTIRLLTAGASMASVDALGMTPPAAEALKNMVQHPNGMVILTGPTGSGKTTTIYACIRHLLDLEEDPASIVSIEDPVENDFGVISQVSVTRGTDEWGYATALRAALRQDVKTLLVGEMRDASVVRMTLEAALTGHRVLTTFHAGDIAAVYARMLHLDFEPFLVASAITGVVNQRLLNRLCPACRRQVPARTTFCREAGIEEAWEADGCDACEFRGTAGRIPVASMLCADDAWCDLVASRPPLAALREAAASRPMGTLRAALRDAVRCGNVSETAAARLAI
jgi:type II secretory ATPase GspE/PulE/Tfp pilus assembly ATPase PilB-like protein